MKSLFLAVLMCGLVVSCGKNGRDGKSGQNGSKSSLVTICAGSGLPSSYREVLLKIEQPNGDVEFMAFLTENVPSKDRLISVPVGEGYETTDGRAVKFAIREEASGIKTLHCLSPASGTAS